MGGTLYCENTPSRKSVESTFPMGYFPSRDHREHSNCQ